MAVAKAVQEALDLDRVLFVVANDPWIKSDRRTSGGREAVSSAAVRLALTRALVGALPDGVARGLEVCDVEIRRGGPSYTVDTLRELRSTQPDADLFLIIGQDLVDQFPTWKEHDVIEQLASVVVVNRTGVATALPAGWTLVTMDPVDISSTDLRRRVRTGEDVSRFTSPAVARAIHDHGLYTGTPSEADSAAHPLRVGVASDGRTT